ncbi:hypothetical protein Cgig2_002175 [Carnegiea gigantea]|uniref:Bet v I/Major latex protein domain-containing protein n=1 Tax=Carnegiea gigantea TaxID=171969 RepID=A0A9Q1KWQ9_9CARY|nr:hypothetical protein Cgig2_002175 [Carnegiea gigantea]
MAQIKEYQGQVEAKCGADKVFDIWTRNAPKVSNMCPGKFPKIELVQGDCYHTPGAIVSWTYATPVDGKHESTKTKLEGIDEKKRSFSYKVIEGDAMNKYYNTCKVTVQIIPKGENCSIVKYRVECEKKSEDAPDPNMYVEFFIGCIEETYCRLYSSA